MNNFSANNIGEMHKALQNTLNQFCEQHGLGSIHMGTIRYDAASFRCKIEVKTKSIQNEQPKPVIEPSSIKIGDRFRQARTEYTVTKTDNPGMFSISVETQNGKRYKIKPTQLALMNKV